MDTRAIALGAVSGFVAGAMWQHWRAGLRFQNGGEARVATLLRQHFVPPSYHLMNHLTLPVEDGTTQIDHVLVSRFGVFVIETKDRRGWIFGHERDARWTQVLYRAKFRFQNPIRQNYGHVCAVQRRLDFLPAEAIRSLVVFTGECEFKTPMPPGVITVENLVEAIQEVATPVMSLNRMQFCVGRLEATRLELSGATDVEHVAYLARRFGRA